MPINITGQSSTKYTNASSNINHISHNNTENHNLSPAKDRPATEDVSLSDRAKFLNKLTQHIAAIPIVDATKVHDIKTKIDSGHYLADYLHVAERLISTESALQ